VSPVGNWRLGKEQQDGHNSGQDTGRKVESSTDVSTEEFRIIVQACIDGISSNKLKNKRPT